jgi:hypothetical protein
MRQGERADLQPPANFAESLPTPLGLGLLVHLAERRSDRHRDRAGSTALINPCEPCCWILAALATILTPTLSITAASTWET